MGGVSGPGEDGGDETQSPGSRTSPCRSASPSVARGPPAWDPLSPRGACASADPGARVDCSRGSGVGPEGLHVASPGDSEMH